VLLDCINIEIHTLDFDQQNILATHNKFVGYLFWTLMSQSDLFQYSVYFMSMIVIVCYF